MENIKIYNRKDIKLIQQYRKIDIEGVPRITNLRIENEQIYVVFEYINGIELSEHYLNKLTAKEIEQDFYDLCKIIKQLHKHDIIHRDIKPANIIKGFDNKIYLIDYGISRVYKQEKSRDTSIFGTEYYAAPEQFGFGQTDHRTCIYQLGTTFKELTKNQKIDKKFSKTLDKCTNFDPEKRFQDINEIANYNTFNSNVKTITYISLAFIHALCISITIDCYQSGDYAAIFFYAITIPVVDITCIYYYITNKKKQAKYSVVYTKVALWSFFNSIIISYFVYLTFVLLK